MKHLPGRLLLLVGLAVALALVLPGTTQAADFHEIKKLAASDAQAEDNFGISVAISGDTAIVAARFEDAEGANAGAAYVYQRGQGGQDNWGEVKKLTASDAQAGDYFGTSVAIDGDIAIVGARFEDAGGNEAGAAYIFQRNQGGPDSWGEVTKLTASDAQATDWFGATVAISGDTAVVGAYLEDAGGNFAGAAYVFQRNQGGANAWGEVAKLTASDAQAEDEFGASVAISSDTIIVGAFLEDAGGAGAGAGYVFHRGQGGADAWGEVTKLTAADAETGDSFGVSVAISGDTVVVGANLEDLAGASAGAAYVFQRHQGGADNWGEVAKLAASDAEAGDFFGSGVSVDGDTAIVGAFREDDGGNNAGAAYVFTRGQGGPDNWGEVKKLTASDAQAGDFFGLRVAVSGGSAIVGAYHEDAAGIDAGAAYLFESNDGPPPVLPGDANCDGLVSSIDAALVLQFVAGLLSVLNCEDAADANSDGEVTSVDAALILQFVAGLVGSLEECSPSSRQYAEAPPLTIDADTTYVATIATRRGDIVLELFSDVPVTTNNFVFLAREGFYDCSTFHRVIPGFVAQGGDPTGTGSGGPGYSIPDEDDGDHGFDAGVIGMANAGPNTAGSQFFITYTAQRQLDADFTAFGRLTSGMDVLLQLTPGNPGNRSAPGDIIETITIEER